jgi:hypothetical protein
MVYYNRSENEKALDYFLKSLETYKLLLPPNHPDIAIAHNKICFVINLIELLSFFTKLKVPSK